MNRMRVQGSFLVFAVVGLLAGCSTTSDVSHLAASPLKDMSRERAASQEVEAARKLIDSGDTSAVIPRLSNVISRYPGTEAALDADYLLGVAYSRIGGYRDAIEFLNEYLQLAPQGKYAKEASDQIAKLSNDYNAKYPTATQLDEQIRQMTEKVAAEPQNDTYQTQLAELLWKRGNYDEAGKIYADLIKRNPKYGSDPLITSRIEFLPNGEYLVLSPGVLQGREAEAQPLVIINTASFRSGQDLFTRESRFYSVTGQVMNRSDSVLYGVQVIVTIYGLGNIVYDTTTVSIGRLNPGEIRAFSVRFSNFENIENINRYECEATFQR